MNDVCHIFKSKDLPLSTALRFGRKFVLVGLALAPLAANASFMRSVEELSDNSLSALRGRYAANGTVVTFGVEMISSWRNSDGVVVGSSVSLQVDGQLRPTLTVSYLSGGGGNPNPGTTTISTGGLSNVSGVAQSIQIGGDGNDVMNGIQVDLNAQPNTPNSGLGGSNLLVQAGSVSADLGAARSTVSVEKNSLSLILDVPGQGMTIQRLSAGGLKQHALVASNQNLVRNSVNLTAVLRPETVGGLHEPTLMSLRGLVQPGAM